jgi:uncharacterized small protein (DUF1192 family)/polyhydroxyalkanoate synthesis regulator phasin
LLPHSGIRLEEAKNINSSLTTLGMVINALSTNITADGNTSNHIPYRNSKLTMLLTDSLGGNSKTILILCCNPSLKHIPETLSTLRFGERAKKIKNNAKINEELSIDELKTLLTKARKEIAQLKARLKNGGIAILDSPLLEGGSDLLMSGSNDLLDGRDSIAGGVGKTLLQEEMERKTKEIDELKERIISLEEELEVEKIRNKEDNTQLLVAMTESVALKTTIQELEEKLLKITLESKNKIVPKSKSVDE